MISIVGGTLFITKNKSLSSCSINNVDILNNLKGKTELEVMSILGKPSAQDMGVKFFQEYTYSFDNKLFYVVIRYDEQSKKVVHTVCKRGNETFAIGQYVIVH